MATTRKSTGRKAGAKKPAGSITKAKAKRVARKAQAVLEGAAAPAPFAAEAPTAPASRTNLPRDLPPLDLFLGEVDHRFVGSGFVEQLDRGADRRAEFTIAEVALLAQAD